MNRSDRRRLLRAGRRDHLDCGCVMRILDPVERITSCSCGAHVACFPVPMPTAAPLGSLKAVTVACWGCAEDVDVLCLVKA